MSKNLLLGAAAVMLVMAVASLPARGQQPAPVCPAATTFTEMAMGVDTGGTQGGAAAGAKKQCESGGKALATAAAIANCVNYCNKVPECTATMHIDSTDPCTVDLTTCASASVSLPFPVWKGFGVGFSFPVYACTATADVKVQCSCADEVTPI